MSENNSLPCMADDHQVACDGATVGYYVMLSAGEYVDGEEQQHAARVRSHRVPALHALIVEAILEPKGLPADMLVRQLLDRLDTVSTGDDA